MNDKETTVILITSGMYIVEYWYLQTTFGSSFDEWVIIRASCNHIFDEDRNWSLPVATNK